MICIGIDTGVDTGFAIWDSRKQRFLSVKTVKIHEALLFVESLIQGGHREDLLVRVEDARKRVWFGRSGREKLQGAGSVKRDSKIWDDYLKARGVHYEMVAPKDNMTKLEAGPFKAITHWAGRTNEHNRDAAMLVFGMDDTRARQRYGKE